VLADFEKSVLKACFERVTGVKIRAYLKNFLTCRDFLWTFDGERMVGICRQLDVTLATASPSRSYRSNGNGNGNGQKEKANSDRMAGLNSVDRVGKG
jgi:hypothetical protein